MAPFPLTVHRSHPYSSWSPAHKHLAPTPFRHAAHSAAAIPFNWTLREGAMARAQELNIHGYDHAREERADLLMGRSTDWVQTKENQLALLDTFFGAIEPGVSLCFFYAKRTPLAEDSRRVIVGVGRVQDVGRPVEYEHEGDGELRSVLWEREIRHTIRPSMTGGFLFPYQALLDAQLSDPVIDLTSLVAFAPDDAFDAFSYGAEHVDHDQAIESLLNCAEALRRIRNVLPGEWDKPLEWIDARLSELWQLRGPCPGLGSALTAYGVEHGTLLSYELSRVLTDNEDPWPLVEEVFADPTVLGDEWRRRISRTLADLWPTLSESRRTLLMLLSRFNLSIDQAKRFYNEQVRAASRIAVSDADILQNPYLIYETDRVSADAVTFGTIDRGVFPDPIVRDAHPLPTTTPSDDPADPRRVRALIVSVLESESLAGHTIRSRGQVIQAIGQLNLQPECPVSYDLLPLVENQFDGYLKRVEMADGEPAYQLSELVAMGELIATTVKRRLAGRRHRSLQNWRGLLDVKLDDGKPRSQPIDETEERAREEKAAALKELFSSRFSVLIGPAGTGKTTLLSVLCNHSKVRESGVLLLAPTGKARVQLERQTGGEIPAQTIAQFLIQDDRRQYDPETGAYTLSTQPPARNYGNVVIDEASMLTEDQLAATLSALDRSAVERIILVGDPRQLPPIGAGRPFVDIINYVAPDDIDQSFPRVGAGYAELTVVRRTIDPTGRRDDVLLARWFSGQALDPGADEIWERVATGISGPTLRFVRWRDHDGLRDALVSTLAEELALSSSDDRLGFERSLGGEVKGDYAYFNSGSAGMAENWQILTPVNHHPHGVDELNRFIQRQFRHQMLSYARSWSRKVPPPYGPEHIVYGDKVMSLVNQRREKVEPRENSLRYVANGEIGLVIGQWSSGQDWKPEKLQVEFSSQFESRYDYFPGEFVDDSAPPLKLAYAVTIHKSQGSEFGTTFIVLPDPLPMLSRELLYTALTRQRDKVVILHQGDLTALKRFDQVRYWETAQRQTNLFRPPDVVEIYGSFLEANLIHRTASGEYVRSKSEVIIGDLLTAHGIEYLYEQELRFPGETTAPMYPDFTVKDAELGITVYWEHLGLLHDPGYRARWERKLARYERAGILPFDEGGGDEGTLVVTRDDERGGIDSAAIQDLIRQLFVI